jgi:hypothetical protein
MGKARHNAGAKTGSRIMVAIAVSGAFLIGTRRVAICEERPSEQCPELSALARELICSCSWLYPFFGLYHWRGHVLLRPRRFVDFSCGSPLISLVVWTGRGTPRLHPEVGLSRTVTSARLLTQKCWNRPWR